MIPKASQTDQRRQSYGRASVDDTVRFDGVSLCFRGVDGFIAACHDVGSRLVKALNATIRLSTPGGAQGMLDQTR